MADPRLHPLSTFTRTTHHTHIPPSLSPSTTSLPAGFTALILGASAGIGAHIAYAFAATHCPHITLILCARGVAGLAAVREECLRIHQQQQASSGDPQGELHVDVQQCDVASEASVQELAAYVRRVYVEGRKGGRGRLDVVIPNAGYAPPVTGMKVTENARGLVGRAMEVNLLGTYGVAREFVPLLLGLEDGGDGEGGQETEEDDKVRAETRRARQGKGKAGKVGARLFLVISSFAGCIRRGIIANTGYTISKMAQIRLVEYLSEQFGREALRREAEAEAEAGMEAEGEGMRKRTGLLSLAIHPGAVNTDMAKGNTPEEFVKYLVDDVGLCGAWVVWFCGRAVLEEEDEESEGAGSAPGGGKDDGHGKGRESVEWMDGRLVSVNWDLDELMARRDEVVRKDLLKFELRTD